ncbi:MAG: F420-nonreducing hydrogenase, partial [Candidatus Methanomethylicia archaeon]
MLSIALFPLTTCSGCENAILDLWIDIEEILKNIEITYAPILMDSEEPKNVDVGLVIGSIRTSEDLNKLFRWRDKSKTLVAFGSCACFGGLPGLINKFDISKVIIDIYKKSIEYESPHSLPKLIEYIKPAPSMVKIDLMVPGCPPPKNLISKFLNAITYGHEFSLPTKNLCTECPLNTSSEKNIREIRRFSLNVMEQNKCFLEQGIICLGPVTRSGCEAKCIKSNTPCRGCLGPTLEVDESAMKLISSLASSLS